MYNVCVCVSHLITTMHLICETSINQWTKVLTAELIPIRAAWWLKFNFRFR